MRRLVRSMSMVSLLGVPAALLLTTLITASPLDEVRPQLSFVLRLLAYGCVFIVALVKIINTRSTWFELLRGFSDSYGLLLMLPVILYFLGLVLGAYNGPALISSLKQTLSDLVVFGFAFVLFGWLEKEPEHIIRYFLISLVTICSSVLVLSYLLYIGNWQSWWQINPYIQPDGRLLMNGIFVHANNLGYFLMIGTFSAGYLALEQKPAIKYRWVIVVFFLFSGLLVTFARGAILGTAIGLVGMIVVHYRRTGIQLMAILAGCVLTTWCLFLFWTGDVNTIYHLFPLGQRLSTSDFNWTKEEYNQSWNVIPVKQGGRIQLTSTSAISTDIVVSDEELYVVTMNVGSYAGGHNEEGIWHPSTISLYVLSGGEMITSRTLQLPEESTWIEAIKFQASADQEYELIIEFIDDSSGIIGKYRNVYISDFLFYPSEYPLLLLPKPGIIPKIDLGNRSQLFLLAIHNISNYGPLGVGAGNAESSPGLGMHNLFLEQLGEGGVLTLLGFLVWLTIPVVRIRKSRLKPTLAWSIVAMMAGLLIHGIFWSEFLNGLRILTLFYVCIWTALMTPAQIEAKCVQITS